LIEKCQPKGRSIHHVNYVDAAAESILSPQHIFHLLCIDGTFFIAV